MNYGLFSNGKYQKFKSTNKLLKKKNNVKYFLIDTSTGLKGPVYTLTDSVCESFNNSHVEIFMDITYASPDCPFSDASIIKSKFLIDAIERHYSIYPLIKQMIIFNFFKNDFYEIDNEINIDSIRVVSDKMNVVLNEDADDSELLKIFKNLKMNTCVKKVFKHKFLIMENGHWYFAKIIPKHFEFIGLEIPGAESFYLLSEEEYDRFSSINNLSITLAAASLYSDSFCEDLAEAMHPIESNSIECSKLASVMETCIFLPQLLLLEKNIYNTAVYLEIDLEVNSRLYHLEITEEEASSGICLFDIINKLIQF